MSRLVSSTQKSTPIMKLSLTSRDEDQSPSKGDEQSVGPWNHPPFQPFKVESQVEIFLCM